MAVVTPVAPVRSRRNIELMLLVLALGVAVAAYALVGLAVDDTLPTDMVTYGVGLGVLVLGVHITLRFKAKYADPTMLPIVTAINGIGLVLIHRLDLAEERDFGSSRAARQLMWTALGVLACIAVLLLVRDHRILSRYTYTAMVIGLVLILLPLLPGLGLEVNGARIWVNLGFSTFQPGELAKIVLTVFYAGYLVSARDSLSLVGRRVLGLQLPRGRDLGPIIVVWAASLAVLIFERDLGTSLLFFGLFVAMLYVATERTSWIVIGMLLFVGGAFVAWTIFGHVQTRVAIWLHPFDPAVADKSYQLIQGLFGMASGGMLGTGLGQGRPDIVPYAETDFILASFGEELGLAGVFALLMLYLLFVERGLRTAIGVRDGFGKLLAAGLSFSVALQVFVVVGGVTRVIPLTGLTMPFLAYGGSSLLSNWMIAGLLLRISDAARRPEPPVPVMVPSGPATPAFGTPAPASSSPGPAASPAGSPRPGPADETEVVVP
jgi:cell division protein FtsW (lipid II flippase)